MSEIDQALANLRRIRGQVARSTQFRGYGPVALCAVAVSALVTGLVQARWVTDAASHPLAYICLWLFTGTFSAVLVLAQMLRRSNRIHSSLGPAMMREAIMHFLPAAIAGFVLPFVLLHASAGDCWMVPGLWQILFSLGVFACCRSLPRSLLLVGAWFLLGGFSCLLLGSHYALRPATMSASYGIGMAMAAALHHSSAKGAPDAEED